MVYINPAVYHDLWSRNGKRPLLRAIRRSGSKKKKKARWEEWVGGGGPVILGYHSRRRLESIDKIACRAVEKLIRLIRRSDLFAHESRVRDISSSRSSERNTQDRGTPRSTIVNQGRDWRR